VIEVPAHPNVNWNVTALRGGRRIVEVSCPECGVRRMVDASHVKQDLAWGKFTGFCKKHRRAWA
jgi:hypothetical protein